MLPQSAVRNIEADLRPEEAKTRYVARSNCLQLFCQRQNAGKGIITVPTRSKSFFVDKLRNAKVNTTWPQQQKLSFFRSKVFPKTHQTALKVSQLFVLIETNV